MSKSDNYVYLHCSFLLFCLTQEQMLYATYKGKIYTYLKQNLSSSGKDNNRYSNMKNLRKYNHHCTNQVRVEMVFCYVKNDRIYSVLQMA
jgi:hypothetical protein